MVRPSIEAFVSDVVTLTAATLRAAVRILLVFAVGDEARAQSINPLPPVANNNVQIWWAPMAWGLTADKQIDYTMHDLPTVFSAPVEWLNTRGTISTFELPGNLVWSYPEAPGGGALSTVVLWVRTHPTKKLNFGSGFVANGGLCGVGIEGESADPIYNVETGNIARIWQQAGGRLDYFTMDGPLFYARVPVSQGGCGYTIQQAAEKTSATMQVVLSYFPDIKFIDADGPGFEATAQWLDDMQAFHAALAALGTPVYATELDVGWSSDLNGQTYSQIVSQAVPFLHLLGEHVGLFLDADGSAANLADDATWLAQYSINAQTIANGHFGEDWIAAESWVALPRNNLPETSAVGFASVVPMLGKLMAK